MYFASLREIAGKGDELVEIQDGATVENLLDKLSKTYGQRFAGYVFEEKTGAPRDHFRFLMDGRSITFPQGFKMKIVDGCLLAIIPPIGGG
jgi:molybdopterin synthase sulfur carrier subunit